MQKQKGFTLLELVIVVAIVGLIVSIAVPSLMRAHASSEFESFFGVRMSAFPSKEQLSILQPLVTRRLQELETANTAQEVALLALPPVTTAGEAEVRLKRLEDIQNRAEYLARARYAAKYYGFQIE